jgi:rubredoxin
MWVLFHRNAKTKVVDGGRSFLEHCPECGRHARFVEVEVNTGYGVFFVDLLSDKERKYRCSACGGVFDLETDDGPAELPPARSERELAAERAALEARRAVEAEQRRQRAEAKAIRIEDELAELKRRLGR